MRGKKYKTQIAVFWEMRLRGLSEIRRLSEGPH